MDITFQNVSITVTADRPEDAYTQLCEALEPFEYCTDTYSVLGDDSTDPAEDRDTSDLFPSDV